MLLLSLLLSTSHVPTYTGCTENCCTPPRHHTTSQVIYLKGSGGLEIHTVNNTFPINIKDDEILDVDAVFKKEYDQTTYDLYIGCGGCVASEDALIIDSKIVLDGYQPASIEPFTQTRYFSVFPKNKRKYNSSILETCNEGHFTIRLVDYENRTDNSEIVWGPVIGLDERFTFLELLEFPIYILKNHGSTWNQLGYTFWIILFIVSPIITQCLRLYVFKRKFTRKTNAREFLYNISIIGFVSALLEETLHLIIVQIGYPVEAEFWVGLFIVILFSQSIGILFAITAWRSLIYKEKRWCSSNPAWAPLEVLTGFGLLFLFGSGFYLGPSAIMLAGLLRMFELCRTRKKVQVQVIKEHKSVTKKRSKFLGNVTNDAPLYKK